MLILSQSEGDATTEEVASWIHYKFGKPEKLVGSDFTKSDFVIEINDEERYIQSENTFRNLKICSEQQLHPVYFRKWASPAINLPDFVSSNNPVSLNISLLDHMKNEQIKLNEWIFDFISSGQDINQGFPKVNKLIALKHASDVGLNIPNTIITNRKDKLVEFSNKNEKIITKAISESFTYIDELKNIHCSLTAEINKDDISSYDDKFGMSLFQEAIDKKYEIRSFVIEEEIYSMAIFSQSNDKTKIDFRNYDYDKPNRCVPFSLPKEIERKLLKFMKVMELNTGSIDLLLDKNNKFIFLEVNTTGQFGMMSKSCNYHLEEKVADLLVKRACSNE